MKDRRRSHFCVAALLGGLDGYLTEFLQEFFKGERGLACPCSGGLVPGDSFFRVSCKHRAAGIDLFNDFFHYSICFDCYSIQCKDNNNSDDSEKNAIRRILAGRYTRSSKVTTFWKALRYSLWASPSVVTRVIRTVFRFGSHSCNKLSRRASFLSYSFVTRYS